MRYAITDETNLIDLGLQTSFYDLAHPAGIQVDVAPRYATFLQFNMADGTEAKDVQLILAQWSAAASELQAGKALGSIRPSSGMPDDTGETTDLYTANLSMAFGLGPSLFDKRFGLADKKPKELVELPYITGDHFDASTSGSDFGIWMRADDQQVIFHAVRAIRRIAGSKAQLTYTHSGYLSARQHGKSGTARGNHGFKVGLTGVSTQKQFDDYVWIQQSDQDWLTGGTYMVYRDTFFDIEPWDNDRIEDQEQCVGRHKDTGAPLSSPTDDPLAPFDFEAKDADGNYLVDPKSHCRLVSEEYLGFKCYSDSYRSWRGMLDNGKPDAGFVNVFFQNTPEHFTRMRNVLGKFDLTNEYYYDTKSALYAVPKAPASGSYVGKELFE